MNAVPVPTKTCPRCKGAGTVPDLARVGQLEAAAWQVPAARRVLASGRPLPVAVREALTLRVENPGESVAALARLAGAKPATLQKRLTRALAGERDL